jgi:alkylation response protein AidB-like acyl-CoA dehydrogenase
MQIFEGTNQIQRLVISRDLAKGLNQPPEDVVFR